MKTRIVLPLAAALVVFAVGSARAQQPAATPQPAPAVAATQATAPAAPPAAQKPTPAPTPAPAASYPNIRIDVTITDQAGTGASVKKSMSLVNAGRNASVRSGVSTPTVQTTYAALASGGVNTVPISSYSYQTRGLNLDVREVSVSNTTGLIHVWLSIEYNPMDETADKIAAATTPVAFSNFSQSFALELENGKPMLVAQTSDPAPNRSRTVSVEVRATIVKQ